MINRRDFLTRTAAVGAGLTLGLPAFGRSTPSFTLTAEALAAGTHLTPFLVVNDALHLTLLNPTISADLKAAMIAHQGFLHASGALARDKRDVVALLATIRDGWATRDGQKVERHVAHGDMLDSKLAFAAGWMANQAAWETLYSDAGRTGDLDDRAVYHDVTLLHALAQGEPVAPSGATPSVDDLTQLFQLMYLRTYMRMHTIDPDFDDVEAWILRVVRLNSDLEALTRRYAEAYLQPDAAKLSRYVETPNFYEASDPLLQLARSLHQGHAASVTDLEEALAASPGRCQYAQALGHAYRVLESVSAFHEGRLNEVKLQKKFQ